MPKLAYIPINNEFQIPVRILCHSHHALQNLNHPKSNFLNRSYGLSIPIPRYIFNEDYPVDPKTFGERLRKARMDAGLKIKELADLVCVTEDTVINWELRGMRPWRKTVREKVETFIDFAIN